MLSVAVGRGMQSVDPYLVIRNSLTFIFRETGTSFFLQRSFPRFCGLISGVSHIFGEGGGGRFGSGGCCMYV